MPGLFVTVLLTVAVIGPVATHLPLHAYLVAPDTRLYLWNALLAPYFVLPGVFDDGRPFTAVNGALWSLPVEVAMYLLLPLYGLARARVVRRVVLPIAVAVSLAAAFWFLARRPQQVEPVVYWTSLPFIAHFASDFVLGAAVRVWRLERWLGFHAALACIVVASLLGDGVALTTAVTLLAVPYVVLAAALAPAPWLAGVGRRTDISYGVYLWGSPVQQLVVSAFGVAGSPLVLFAASLPVAWGCGWLSWRLVESRALRLKPVRGPVAAPVLQPAWPGGR